MLSLVSFSSIPSQSIFYGLAHCFYKGMAVCIRPPHPLLAGAIKNITQIIQQTNAMG